MEKRSQRYELVFCLAIILVVALLPLVKGGFRGQLPSTALKIAIYAIMALGLNVVIGYVGLLDLGYVTFMATGAALTAAAMVAVTDPQTGAMIIPVGGRMVKGAEHLFHFPASYLVVMLFCGIVCAALGALRGLPTLHLTGDYYAIVTLGIAEIIYIWYKTAEWTGGPKSIAFNSADVPELFGKQLYYDEPVYYYLVVVVLALAILGSIHLRESRVGRAMAAIRLDPTAAMSCGVNLSRYKMVAFAVSGFIGGVGGSLFCVWSGGFSAIGVEVWESILLVCCLVLGGIGSVRGALLGAVVMVALGEVLREDLPKFSAEKGFHLEPWDQKARFLFYGVVLVLLMRFRPGGVLPDRLAADKLRDETVERVRKAATPLFRIGGNAQRREEST